MRRVRRIFLTSIVCLRPPFASLLRFRCACVDHSFGGFKCGIAAVLARVRCWRFTSRMRHANARVVAIFLALREPEAIFCVWRGARSASEIPSPTSAAGHPDRAGRSWTTTGPVGVVAAAITGKYSTKNIRHAPSAQSPLPPAPARPTRVIPGSPYTTQRQGWAPAQSKGCVILANSLMHHRAPNRRTIAPRSSRLAKPRTVVL